MFAVVRRGSLGLHSALPRLVAAVSIALAAGPALAASGDWSATTSGDWSDAGNWNGGTVADGAGFTATFASDITAPTTVTLDSARTISAVVFGDANTSTAGSWTIGGGSNTLTMNGNSGNATLTVNALGTGATATISRPIATANISGSLVKNGVGTLILGADNSAGLADKITISAGSLQISNQNQLGAVPGSFVADQLTISGGATLRITAGTTTPQNRGITIGSGGATLNVTGVPIFEAPFSGSGNTVTTVGGLNLSNQTATATNVNWDFTTGRIFYNTSDSLGTGSVRVRNGVRLVSQNNGGTSTLINPITLDSGAGITARSTSPTVSYDNVIFPSAGTIIFNKDDQATTAFSITSGVALTGDLTFNTWQEGAAALGAVTLSGVFSGAGGITKAGSGTDPGKLTLGGANTYSGNTTINAGTLALGASGSIANSLAIVLSAASTSLDVSAVTGGFTLGAAQSLTGVGSVVGSVTANGTLSPGLAGGVGTLSFGSNLSLGSGSVLSYQLNGTDVTVGGAVNDLISLAGNLTLDGTINVTESVSGSFLLATAGNTWRLANYTGTLTDNGLSLGTMPALASGLTFGIDTTTANQVNLVVNAVPEPGTIATTLVGFGLLGGLAARRRARRGS